MNAAAAVERIAKAVLYEGYMLYPYRPSAVKNQQRFNFGVVYPQSYSEAQKGADPWIMQTECLIQGSAQTAVEVHIRFLQLTSRSIEQQITTEAGWESSGKAVFVPVKCLEVDGQKFYSWEEAVEREMSIPLTSLEGLVRQPAQQLFSLPPKQWTETLGSDKPAGRLLRAQQAIDGEIYVAAHPVHGSVHKIVVRVRNATSLEGEVCVRREEALTRSLISAHIILSANRGDFVSLLDPPAELRESATLCRNLGVFPVLVGEEGRRETMLACPIILYDYPQIAPESAGDLFDGTEIDEILSLRIMTMTDDEKLEMRQSDERARQMLERIETLPVENLMRLHGVLRGLRPLREDSQ
jgi:hydrogenase maturation protease